jgi:hypothetical protein
MTPGSDGMDVLVFARPPFAAYLEGFGTADMLAGKQVFEG